MADEQKFDRAASRERMQQLARRIQDIEDRVGSVAKFYFDKTPTDERDEALYMDGMRTKLVALENALRDFINREF
jgi:hypothetical protein